MVIAAVHVASWREAYRGIVAVDFLDAMVVSDRARRYTFGLDGPNDPRTWICLDDGDVVGFVTTGPNRDENLVSAGEVLALYVTPCYWRSGAGTMLMGKAEEELRSGGCRSAALWVLEANDRGRAFYEARGWRTDGATDTSRSATRTWRRFGTRRSSPRGEVDQSRRLGRYCAWKTRHARYLRYVNYQTNHFASSERE